MFFLDEFDNYIIKRKQYLLPVNMKDKRHGSVAILLAPNYESSKSIINHPLFTNKYFNSYYLEKSAMYYINQEGYSGLKLTRDDQYIEESVLFDKTKDSDRIIYKGYSIDSEKAMQIVTFKMIDSLNKDYQAKIKYPLTVEVFKRYDIPETNSTEINLISKDNFDYRIYKNYECYCKFQIMLNILLSIDSNMNKYILYSTALYESGLYNLCKRTWKFNPDLKKICQAIDNYIKDKNQKSFISNIVKKSNHVEDVAKLLYVYLPAISISSLDDMLNILKGDIQIIESFFAEEKTKDLRGINESEMTFVSDSRAIVFNEDATYDTVIKRMIYSDRIKTTKEIFEIYDKVKKENPSIKYTYVSLDKYKKLNTFIDLSFYNELFVKNNTFKLQRGYKTYMDLIERFLTDKRIKECGYNKKTIIIPVLDWDDRKSTKLWMINEGINPISCIYRAMMTEPKILAQIFGDSTVLFLGNKCYFTIDFSKFDPKKDINLYTRNIKLMRNKDYIPMDDVNEPQSSSKAITVDIVDKIEKSQNIKIDNIEVDNKTGSDNNQDDNVNDLSAKKIDQLKNKNATTQKNKSVSSNGDVPKVDTKEIESKQKELVEKISKAADKNISTDNTLDSLDQDIKVKELISDIVANDSNPVSAARKARSLKLQNDLSEKEFKNRSMKELLKPVDVKNTQYEDLPSIELKVDSINEEWKELKYPNSFDVYDLDKDLVNIFTNITYRDPERGLNIISIDAQDTSNSEDSIETYTVKYEAADTGERFTVVVDIPKLLDNRYMKLRGNRKEIPNQLFLMPVSKTDEDTTQIVSCYNKIFIRRFGTTVGKSNVTCSKLIKVLSKNKFDGLQIIEGYNVKICSKYELPIDYIDLSSIYSKFVTTNTIYFFNQDEIRKVHKNLIDDSKGIPYAYDKLSKNIRYFSTRGTKDEISFSYRLAMDLMNDLPSEFTTLYVNAPVATKYTYSRASILNTDIPLIVICAYSEGLEPVLRKANIKYDIWEKRPKDFDSNTQDIIKFKDGYLVYELDYASSLLMNGLKDCPTDETSIIDINNKTTYIGYLDLFGGRIKSDGLDNFYSLMIDKPITYEILQYYKLPTDYIELLLYANQLLADNKYIKHTAISGNKRIRRNEQIASLLYETLANEYGTYCTSKKHGRKAGFNIKRNAVINKLLTGNTTSDQSVINALYEYESYSAVTPRGQSGMNSDRSYTLDKRSYDDSMLNVLSMSTGFAGNVGVVRQATIDANISGVRGYINNEPDKSKLSSVKSLCMTEALTPFGTTRDDPFRTAMTYVQTSKHGMRCRKSDPLLVTTGADEALPMLISNTFVHKAKDKGKVIEKTDNFMILEYSDGSHEFVSLDDNVEKNSSSGFYVSLKLDSDYKVGSTFKKDDIVAYDKSSFSDKIGNNDNIAYNIGTMCKFAILYTDEGYEDSAIISEDLSGYMTSDVLLKKEVNLTKDTNIYNMVKKGQYVNEGDPLLIIQSASDEEDTNTLLKNLSGDVDEITDLGRIPITAKVSGTIHDIVITRTVDKDQLSPTLKKVVNSYEKDIIERKKTLEKYGISTKELPSTETLPATGKLKNVQSGVLIEFYINYEDRMSVGDKLIYYSALKGVVKDIFPEGKEPTSEYRPNEKLHSLLSIGGVNARMVTSILINSVINKGLIELSRKCKDILGIKYPDDLQ